MSASAPVSNPPASTHTFRSLEYGLDLLRQFTPEHPVRGIAELAAALNVSRPTAHRYASTCLELGYLEQAATRRYRLTRRCAEPGMAMLGSLALVRGARPILRELRRGTGRTVSLAVLDGPDRVLYLVRLCGFERGQYKLDRGLGAGSRLPAVDTAAGWALLNVGARSESGLTIVEAAPLDGRARGIAVSVPPGTEGERTSAIEITVPAAAMGAAELIEQLGEELRAAGAALQGALDG
jgi:DNA-binding IclR family transcriptional regulator